MRVDFRNGVEFGDAVVAGVISGQGRGDSTSEDYSVEGPTRKDKCYEALILLTLTPARECLAVRLWLAQWWVRASLLTVATP